MAMKLGRGVAIAVVVFGTVISAISCGKTEDGTDSNTHWMHSCEEDSECGILKCLCGVCTRSCEESASCSGLGDEATCSALEACGVSQARICVREGAGGSGGGAGGAGSGGQPSSGGAGGGASGSGGTVDIPDAPATGPCAPMNAMEVSAVCDEPRRWHWDGDHCRPTTCCGGSDCDKRYDTVEACDLAHAQCYADNGISRSCTKTSDCVLTQRTCCFCGENTSSDVIAMRAESTGPYEAAACDYLQGECPPCVPAENPALHAMCVEGECRVLDTERMGICDQDDDCVIRELSCCGTCSKARADWVAISQDDDTSLIPFKQAVCGSNITGLCDAIDCPPPSELYTVCDPSLGRCAIRVQTDATPQ